jgi:hypothetical protein
MFILLALCCFWLCRGFSVFVSLFGLILIAGRPIYAAADYLNLTRSLYYIPYLSPIHPGRVVSTFIGVDVIIESLISNGAVKLANLELSLTQVGAAVI